MKTGERYDVDEGVLYSCHVCETCGQDFEVAPAIRDDETGWADCMAPECPSYDPVRDADWLVGIINPN